MNSPRRQSLGRGLAALFGEAEGRAADGGGSVREVAVELIRPAMLGRPATDIGLHVAVLAGYAVGGFVVSAWLFRRRMMR